MNEIEKMYENAKVKPFRYCYNCVDNNGNRIEDSANCPSRHNCSNTCDTPEYEFTAEKQIELIKWISHHDGCFKVYLNSIEFGDTGFGSCFTFEESLAKAVSNFLMSATDKEKQQIKEILE